MKKYLVEYYYLATGMEGIPDRQVEGEVYAMTKSDAIDMIMTKNHSHESARTQSWVRGCLRAIEIVEEENE